VDGVWLASYVVLWGVVVIQAFAMTALLRQIGVLYLRMPATGARSMNVGPDIGTTLERRDAIDVLGERIGVVDHKRPKLLLFVSPTCGTCEELLPSVRTLARNERDALDVVLLTAVSDGVLNKAYVKRHKLSGIPYVASAAIAQEYGVLSSPYALAVDAQGVVRAKGLVNHGEHLESLVVALRVGHATMQSYMAAMKERSEYARP
jgi:methylamine dehydrogenase accessory protein MauD